jgi:hypothetical protein
MNPTTNQQKAVRGYSKHGLTVLKRAVNGLGNRAIDRRTTLGKALAKWRTDLVNDLGGANAISTQQQALVELAVRSKLLLDSIDNWLLTQKSLVNARKKSLLPVVRERQALADGLAKYLAQLGMKRVPREESLKDIVAAMEAEEKRDDKVVGDDLPGEDPSN